jgi:WXG100 family type VII secretion target
VRANMFLQACPGMGPTRKRVHPVAGAKLDSTVLRSTATTSIDIAGQINSIVSAVDAQLHGALLGGQWKGLGGNAAAVAWADLRSRLTSLQTALQNIGRGLGDVHTNYVVTDETQQQNVNAVSTEAGGIPAALGVNI